jgi:hypothetical protein
MNSSPVDSFDGAAAIFTFAANEGLLKGTFWVMCGILVLVVVASMVHEIAVSKRIARRSQ